MLIVIARIRSCLWRGFNLSNLYSSLSHWLRSIALAAWHRQKAENQLSVPFNFLYILCPFWYSTEFDIKALLGKGRRLAWKLWPRHVMKLFLFPCPPRSNFLISRLICNNTTYFVFCHEAWDFWTPSHRPLPSFDKHLGSSPIFTLLIRDPCKLLPRLTFPRKQTFHTIFLSGYFLHCEKPSPLTEPNQQGISFLYCNITLTILFGNKNPVIFLSQSRSGKSNPSQEGGNTKTIEPCLISSFGRDPRFEPPGCRRRSAESPSPSSPEALPGSARWWWWWWWWCWERPARWCSWAHLEDLPTSVPANANFLIWLIHGIAGGLRALNSVFSGIF